MPEERKCIKNCSLYDAYKFEFRNICYSNCPQESKEVIGTNYCEALCNEKNPFVIVDTQECVELCDINLILSGLCQYRYNTEKKR